MSGLYIGSDTIDYQKLRRNRSYQIVRTVVLVLQVAVLVFLLISPALRSEAGFSIRAFVAFGGIAVALLQCAKYAMAVHVHKSIQKK